jgi:peptidoglycan biosynthesis protein MviN/MurJ (putative lipid II flippase)
MVEVAVRSFYSRKDSITPLITAGFKLAIYVVSGILLVNLIGVPGLALADCIAYTSESILLLILFTRYIDQKVNFIASIPRGILSGQLDLSAHIRLFC